MNLVLVEHDGKRINRGSLHALSIAREFAGSTVLLLIGADLDPMAEEVASYGAEVVLVADDDALRSPVADRYAAVMAVAASERGATRIIGASSTFVKDVLPRAAALMDWPMLSDVVEVRATDDGPVYRRPVQAGSAFASVRLQGENCALSIRATAFEAPVPGDAISPIERLDVPGDLPDGIEFISETGSESDRPSLTEASVVVSGGRPLADSATFETLIGGLADELGAAVGATRAAVDAGIAPNDWQIGQTGKVIGADLYIAVGVSGAIQHLAGIKDSRVIVAVNRDAEAPICEMATYVLKGDLYQTVPELIDALRASTPDGSGPAASGNGSPAS